MSHSPRQTKHTTSVNRDSSGKLPSKKDSSPLPRSPKGHLPMGVPCMHAHMHVCSRTHTHTHTHIRTAPRLLSSVFTQQVLFCNRGNKHVQMRDGGLEANSTLPPIITTTITAAPRYCPGNHAREFQRGRE